MADCPETQYCLAIEVTLTEEAGAASSPSHTWHVPMVEDMLQDGKSGLTKAVVTGPARAVLFYGRWSQGEGLSLGKVRDAMFTLSGAIGWVGKSAHLNTHPLSLQEGHWVIALAITDWWVKARGPGCPHSHQVIPKTFRFCGRDESPQEERSHSTNEHIKESGSGHQPSHHRPQQVWDHGPQQLDHWVVQPLAHPPSLDHGFKSDMSLASMASSVLSWSDRLEGSQCPHHGQHCRETRGNMKINLPVFKDEDMKDTVASQSWHWDLTVYQCARCQDHTLLPYTIHSLQGYPGELVRSSGMDITLDDVLTILDEHYNNVKALDALNQELF